MVGPGLVLAGPGLVLAGPGLPIGGQLGLGAAQHQQLSRQLHPTAAALLRVARPGKYFYNLYKNIQAGVASASKYSYLNEDTAEEGDTPWLMASALYCVTMASVSAGASSV